MGHPSLQRFRLRAGILGVAALLASVLALPSLAHAATTPTPVAGAVGGSLSSQPATGSTVHLDGVTLAVDAPFVPRARFDTTEPGARAQVASAASYRPFRDLTVATVPYGTTSTLEVPVPATAGATGRFQAAARERFAAEGRPLAGAPPSMLFGQVVPGDAAVVEDRTALTSTARVLVVWVAEAGGRAWVVRAEADAPVGAIAPEALLAQMSGVVVASSNPEARTTVGQSPPATPADPAGAGARAAVSGPLATGPLDAPSFSQAPWWNGTICDAGYNPQHNLIGSWGSLIACGANNDMVTPSYAGPPYWNSQLEWECVELSWRYLYLRYQVPDQYGNGVDVVDSAEAFLSSHPTVATSLTRQPVYPNPAAHVIPLAGDVVSYSDPSRATGHTNVVTASTVDGNGNGSYTTLNQNWNGGAPGSALQTWSISNWMPQYPAGAVKDWLHSATSAFDGSFVITPDGSTYRIAGGAPLLISNCAPFGVACTSPTPVGDLSGFQRYPSDGITLQVADGGGGAVMKIAGGAPLVLSSCAAGCGSPIGVNEFTIATLSPEPGTGIHHLNLVPSDGTTLREADGSGMGAEFRVAGGAPMYISSCAPDCGSLVSVNQFTIAQLGPEPDSTTRHLNIVPSDGTVLQETDGPRDGSGSLPRFKVAGGAPLLLSSCAPGCGSPVWVNQYAVAALGPEPGTSIHHLRLVPPDGTTLREVDGSAMGAIFKVAGGAPMFLTSCAAGCGSPVNVNQTTVSTLAPEPGTLTQHLSRFPSDGTTLQMADGGGGAVFKVGGGAPLLLYSCAAGCGTPVQVNQATITTLALEPGSTSQHLNLFPADGTTLREADGGGGAVMKVAGGAPLVLYTCAPGCGSPVDVNYATISTLAPEPDVTTHHLRFIPADGTTLQMADGGGWAVMKIAGGAPLVLYTCAAGCGSPVQVNQATIATLAPEPGASGHHLNYLPADGTTVREADGTGAGAIFKMAGASPLYLNSCALGCGSPVDVNQLTLTQLAPDPGTSGHHLNLFPADGTNLREADGSAVGTTFKVAGGAPLFLASCAPGCSATVDVSQYAITGLGPEPGTGIHHLNLVPADGTTIQEVDGGGGAILKVAGGAPMVLSSCIPGCGSPIPVNWATVVALGPEPSTGTHHLNRLPAEGTTLREADGAATGSVFKIAGGAPMYLSSCVPGCGTPIDINQFTITQLGPDPGSSAHHLNLVAADGVTLREADGTTPGAVYKVVGGAPVYMSSCASGCGVPVDVNQYTIVQLGPEPSTPTHHLM